MAGEPGAQDVAWDPDLLLAQVKSVRGIADDTLTPARQAAQSAHLGSSAYGVLCQALPAMLSGVQGVMVENIGGAIDSLNNSGDHLRSAAERYERREEANRAAARKLRTGQ